ncbi:hypothetical protein ARMSODRAFT_886737, partial [Armillaria solidipes]
MECWNCHKRGHTAAECWSKGGGQEGKGPARKGGKKKGRKAQSNQAAEPVNSDLAETSYHVDTQAQFSSHFARNDWLADSGTTSHISNSRQTFVNFKPL